ncbi:hypothetical protein BCU68_09255 [Vibrio sp. 10N.286.49.B3]|uniref:YjbH domain-containing protein n=1 Tax=Vibrio sp. 10N.286.49.B3 TaxID=1880855 RepID=UPI000C81D859|nr:YjbH domain-containing protein [Vibrio sp. 10N.286.49.B3]PMH45971.1 hypothetical protein BCU68_09255 [Vibrio sp. 10N.286.49.B3]
MTRYSQPLIVGSLAVLSLAPTLANAQSNAQPVNLNPVMLRPSMGDFGGVGLMQMRTGRMAPVGEFNAGFNYNDDYYHYSATMQVFSWLEATARYSRVPHRKFNTNPDFSGDNIFTDKGFDFKIRLWEESYWLPETSLGIQDFAGSGLFDSEYIAATKQFGNLDFTLGFAWGYLGQSGNMPNPFCKLSSKYCDRDAGYNPDGGSVEFERWFKGNASVYGGIEYQTTHQPLRFKVEYDANDYTSDRSGIEMPQHAKWNFGLLYQLGNWADMKVSYQRGDTLTLGVNLFTNFNELYATWRDVPKQTITQSPSSADLVAGSGSSDPQDASNPQTAKAETDWDAVAKLLEDNAGYKQNSLSLVHDASLVNGDSGGRDTLVLVGEQKKYRDRDEALDRAAAILANASDADTYRIIEQRNGVPMTLTDIDADLYYKVASNGYIGAKLDDAIIYHGEVTQEGANQDDKQGDQQTRLSDQTLAENKTRWDAGLSPILAQSVGGPESFYFFHLGVNAGASLWLTDKVEASGSIYFNIADNYDKFNYVDSSPHISNHAVPRVRTMFRSYVHDNPIRLNHLQLTWFDQAAEEVYTQAYAGYLEMMFAGIGGEVLYRPMAENWALGLDLNLVSQRDPDSWFGVFDEAYYYFDGYDSSNCDGSASCQNYVLDKGVTGFITAYYMPQWDWLENSLLKVSAGQFLGGDIGARLDISKQFKSGMIVGGYVTRTELSTVEYGEGSYNKGIYVSIPFDILTVKPSTSRGQFGWQPITRDGGQILNRKYQLFDVTDARSPWYQRKNVATP